MAIKATVDPSDRKFYIKAAERGDPQALKSFDARLKAQSSANSSPSEKLRATNPNTKSLQAKLSALGHNAGPEDGISGQKTTAAIKAFQAANGLVADGIAGPKTLAALNGASGVKAATSTPPKIAKPTQAKVDGSDRRLYLKAADREVDGAKEALRKFDDSTISATPSGEVNGEHIVGDLRKAGNLAEAHQLHLQMLGYNPGDADGILGKKTGEAVVQFQKDHGLAADGIMGPKTRAALNEAAQVRLDEINKAIDARDAQAQQKDDPAPAKPAKPAPAKVDGSDRKFYTKAVDQGVPGAKAALKTFGQSLSDQASMNKVDGEHFVKDLIEADSSAKAYQLHLQMLGYNPGDADGVLGKQTGEAVVEFQKDHGLAADGIIGPETRAALNEAAQGKLDEINKAIDARDEKAQQREQPQKQEADAPPATNGQDARSSGSFEADPNDIFQFDQTNPVAWVLEKPSQAVLETYEEGFTRLPGFDPENGRSPYRTGFGPAVIRLDRVSPNAIDDFHGTAANLAAAGGTVDYSFSFGPSGFDASVDGSLQAERIFEGAGLEFLQSRDTPLQQEDSWIEFNGSHKLISSLGQANHFEHDAEGLNRQSSSVTAAQVNGGNGGVFDIRIPGTDHRFQIGGAKVGEIATGRLSSTTASGFHAEDGRYGAALGGGAYAKGVTANLSLYTVADSGLGVRYKGSATVHKSLASEGADTLGLIVWDDNTGTFSFELAGGAAPQIAEIGVDLAGEIQVEQAAGTVQNTKDGFNRFFSELTWRIDPRNQLDRNHIHG